MELGKDSFGDKIKRLENIYRYYLPNRLPVILRIDGCHFRTVVKNCKKPFDENLINALNETGIYLCKNIQGAQICYQQSDELSILLFHKNELAESWFNNNLQKMVSVSAAMASSYFTSVSHKIFGEIKVIQFDSRAFVLQPNEVSGYFDWRQKDCIRNSVQSVARSLFSHKECNNKDTNELKQLCLTKNVNWDKLPIYQKMGRCIVKNHFLKEGINSKTEETFSALRSEWIVDNNIPNFSKDRNYIEQYINEITNV